MPWIYSVKDYDTSDVINLITVGDDEEYEEMMELAEAQGFYLEYSGYKWRNL